MDNNTRAQQTMPFMKPEIDIVKVLETRNIDFDEQLTMDYVQQVIEVLDKIET